MKVEIIEKWQCPTCNKWYADDDDDLPNFASDGEEAAQKCCTQDVDSRYFCPVCDESFWRRQDAEDHLKIPHVGGGDPTPTEIYLERLRFSKRPVYILQDEYIKALGEDAKTA